MTVSVDPLAISGLAAPVRTRAATPLTPLRPGDARITGGFWHVRQDRNRRTALRAGHRQLEESGTLQNFRIAAGTAEGEAEGMIFQDSDVYKWLEAVAYEIGREDDGELRRLQQDVTATVAAAQQDDGYLNSVHQLRHSVDATRTSSGTMSCTAMGTSFRLPSRSRAVRARPSCSMWPSGSWIT